MQKMCCETHRGGSDHRFPAAVAPGRSFCASESLAGTPSSSLALSPRPPPPHTPPKPAAPSPSLPDSAASLGRPPWQATAASKQATRGVLMGHKRRLSRLVSQPLADLYPRLRPATSCRHIALGKHTRTGRQAQRRRQTHRLAHRECERLVARERERDGQRQERQRRSERERQTEGRR